MPTNGMHRKEEPKPAQPPQPAVRTYGGISTKDTNPHRANIGGNDGAKRPSYEVRGGEVKSKVVSNKDIFGQAKNGPALREKR